MTQSPSLRGALDQWHRDLEENGVELASDGHMMIAQTHENYAPVSRAKSLLMERLKDLPPDQAAEVEDIVDTMCRACAKGMLRVRGLNKSTTMSCSSYLEHIKVDQRESLPIHRRSHPNAIGKCFGVSIDATTLGRQPSASYCLYDRMGGWESLSAVVTGVYERLLHDHRVSDRVQAADEHALKTHMVDFFTVASGGGMRGSDSPRLWQSHARTVEELGLGPLYFDVMMEAWEAILLEFNLPNINIKEAIAMLKNSRDTFEEGHGKIDLNQAFSELVLMPGDETDTGGQLLVAGRI